MKLEPILDPQTRAYLDGCQATRQHMDAMIASQAEQLHECRNALSNATWRNWTERVISFTVLEGLLVAGACLLPHEGAAYAVLGLAVMSAGAAAWLVIRNWGR
jgi:hypothetical protein